MDKDRSATAHLTLLTGSPVEMAGVGHIRCPTLREVERRQQAYTVYLHLLTLDAHTLASVVEPAVPPPEAGEIGRFNQILAMPDLLQVYEEMLSFFLCETLRFDAAQSRWLTLNEDVPIGSIGPDNFDDLIETIRLVNGIGASAAAPRTFRNAKARDIYEGIERAKRARDRHQNESRYTLGDIVSYLCVNSSSYNLFNVWNLTIYQLYDQFTRQAIKTQLDTYSLRWAAWGQDPFDFSTYYRSLNQSN